MRSSLIPGDVVVANISRDLKMTVREVSEFPENGMTIITVDYFTRENKLRQAKWNSEALEKIDV